MKRMPFHTTALLRRFAAGFFLVAGMLSCSAPQATFTNPLRDGADPWITKYDGRYYTCFKWTAPRMSALPSMSSTR